MRYRDDEVRRDEPHTDDTYVAATGATLESERMEAVRESEIRSGSTRPGGAAAERPEPLFSPREAEAFRTRWEEVQIAFVDEPRQSVEKADQLVSDVTKRLADVFSNERTQLEGQWSADEDVSTEDLRLALRRYRSFFDRLLSV